MNTLGKRITGIVALSCAACLLYKAVEHKIQPTLSEDITLAQTEAFPEPDILEADESEASSFQEDTGETQPSSVTEAPPVPLTPQEQLAQYLADDPRTPVTAKGIYISGPIAGTVNTLADIEAMIDSTELNTVVIDIKNDAGEITYKMQDDMVMEIGAGINYIRDINSLITRLKEKNIYLIARIVAFKDPLLASAKPEYSVKNPDGSIFYDKDGTAWVNPYCTDVWDYLINVSKEAVALGFDEIQYDYIRFSTAKGIGDADFGPESIGKTKEDAINGFLSYAYETLAPLGVYVSADVFGTIINVPTDGESIGQNFVEMAKRCDYICPMVYPSHYNNGVYGVAVPDTDPYTILYSSLSEASSLLLAEQEAHPDETIHMAKIRPWLQDFTASWVPGHISYGGDEIRDQIQGGLDAGIDEWILWNAANRYTAEGLLPE